MLASLLLVANAHAVQADASSCADSGCITGLVVDVNGTPLVGVSVTLFLGLGPDGPFTVVPAGDAMLNPNNRQNPRVTGSDGRFAFDALAGFYEIRVTKPGCGPVTDSPRVTDRTLSFRVPPAADFTTEGERLVLDCGATAPTTSTSLAATVASSYPTRTSGANNRPLLIASAVGLLIVGGAGIVLLRNRRRSPGA